MAPLSSSSPGRKCLLAAAAAALLCLLALPAVRALEEIDTEAELADFLAIEGDHELVVVCAVPPGVKWKEERQHVEIAEAFFAER